jgi:hypothetical protein
MGVEFLSRNIEKNNFFVVTKYGIITLLITKSSQINALEA